MSFLDTLRNARSSAATCYQQFVNDNPRFSNHVLAFFEGHDDPSFYYTFLRTYIDDPKKIHVYKCGNKNQVYTTYSKIVQRNDIQNIVLFFVDKDLSDILNEQYVVAPNIYVTEYYSIENYLVSEEMFVAVFVETFQFAYNSGLVDFMPFYIIFQRELKRFYGYLLPIMAWIIFLKRNGYRPTLNDIDLSQVFVFNEELVLETRESVKKDGEIAIIGRKCGVSNVVIPSASIDAIIAELTLLDPKKYIRGKFELWFFVKYIEKLIDIFGKMQHLTGKVNVKTRISESTAVAFLGPRLRVPPSLDAFLSFNLPLQP
ncbi:MAG TPA: DUF4435 domain-containing protein [Herpetosiphonaceae bacterium]